MQPGLLEAFVHGFLAVFIWPTLGYMMVGIVIGFIVGILPGLGGTVALAIILPFTFDLRPVDAFALLLATATVTSTAGDLTSILFGIPGEGASAALVPDGYPMTKKGEAGRALAGNLLASLIGAAVGAFAIVAAIPIVRPLVASFGSPEFFMIVMLGITFVASLSTGTAIKGLMAGLLGLFISLVGMDALSGTQRYTFGQIYLWDGLGLVPVALGLFGIPELYDLAVRKTSIAHTLSTRITGVWQGVKDCFIHFWLIVRCSLIGTFIGIMPGLGASVAQWVAYGHAVQTSPNKERFGRGAPEGALGPGAANNSGLGGGLITLVAFGLPGGLYTAMLLGALLIHGIVPGPSMLTTHLDLTMSFVWVIVVSNVFVVLMCFPILGYLAKITFLRGTLVIPSIVLLVYTGAFAYRNAMMDIFITLAFGVIGIVLVKLGWPRPPLILGLVLGGLAENYLFLSTARYGLDFLTRPLVLVLMLLIVAALAYPIVERRLRRKLAPLGITLPTPPPPVTGGAASDEPPPSEPEAPRSEPVAAGAGGGNVLQSEVLRTTYWERLTHPNTLFTLFIVAIAAWAVWDARMWDLKARLFPWVVGIPLVTIGGVYVILQLGGWIKDTRAEMELAGIGVDVDPATIRRRSLEFVAWLLIFVGGVWLLGFVWGAPALNIAYMKLVGREKWGITLILAGVLAVSMWLMRYVLQVPFHDGIVWPFLRGLGLPL